MQVQWLACTHLLPPVILIVQLKNKQRGGRDSTSQLLSIVSHGMWTERSHAIFKASGGFRSVIAARLLYTCMHVCVFVRALASTCARWAVKMPTCIENHNMSGICMGAYLNANTREPFFSLLSGPECLYGVCRKKKLEARRYRIWYHNRVGFFPFVKVYYGYPRSRTISLSVPRNMLNQSRQKSDYQNEFRTSS